MQQQKFCSSYIKINGIPLLSPLMTDSIKEEMKHYRFLAIKVEEKLKSRQLVKCNIKDKCVQADVIETDKLKSIEYDSDSDLSTRDTTSDTNNSESHSRTTIIEPMMQITGETRDKHDIQSDTSDVQHSQLEVSLTDNIVETKPTTTETDQNEYINATKAPALNEDISSENWKPKVPNTLNIVPIILSNEEENISSLAMASKEDKSPPKLSRQGSYVLDTPSPMLLAHMHTELINKNYVPTPTSTHTNNVSQRKQWNIAQPKIKWENEQLVAEDTKASNKLECTTSESTTEHTKLNREEESYQVDQFVNSTKTEGTEEHVCNFNVTSTKHNDISDTSLKNQNSLIKDNDTCLSNLPNEKSAEDASSLKSQSSCIDENKYCDKVENTKEYQNLITKTKSSITPEKLLIVYKEIEEMHKKQMMELINRQQKEQSLLQAEFQKQQMLLLAEIQKCSSSISYQVNASSNITSNITSNQLSINKERVGDIISETGQQLNVNPASNLHVEAHYNSKSSPMKHTNVIVCPLDYITSKNLYLFKHYKPPLFITDTSSATPDFDFTREVNLCDTTYNNNNNNDDDNNCGQYNRIVYKNSNVNRQLFPLNSNTTHVPILDTSMYLNKHIQAVNIINAYTRGYLVRRLMRIERVITLKKIYKEALQCMLKLHVDAPLNLAEVDFLHRLQLQCDAASMNIVDLFAQSPAKKMKVIAQDREIKQSRMERPTSSRSSYSFATQKTLARKNLKEFESTMTKYQRPLVIKKNAVRSRCQTWTSDIRDKLMSPNTLHQGIRRSTSAGTVRKPWR